MNALEGFDISSMNGSISYGIKYWNGAGWASGTLKRYTGTGWQECQLKHYNGATWI